MSEDLVKVLNELLNEVAEEMRSIQLVIAKRQDEVQRAQREVKLAEDREACAIYEDEQAMQKVEVLRVYLNRLGEHPRVLLGKMQRLSKEQERTAQARDAAGRQIANMKYDLHGRQTQLAVVEQRHTELQKQWGEVSEHIANVQRSA